MSENDEITEALKEVPDIEAPLVPKKRKYETIHDDENITIEMNIQQADKQLEEDNE